MSSTEQKISALRQAAQSSPEYAEIVPLFIGIYDYVQGREAETGIIITPSGSVPGEGGDGSPQISAAGLAVDPVRAREFLSGIIEVLVLNSLENKEFINKIAAALQNGSVDPLTLYQAILDRRRAPVDECAALLAVPAPLVEYIFEIPLKTALGNFSAGYGEEDFTGWQVNFCPVCGSRAAMAELCGEEGRRMLFCSACSFRWPFRRLACACCGCEDPEQLSYFTAGDGLTRVDTCKACSRYIKTRDSRRGDSHVPLEIEDLLTIHLDLLASREGFERGK